MYHVLETSCSGDYRQKYETALSSCGVPRLLSLSFHVGAMEEAQGLTFKVNTLSLNHILVPLFIIFLIQT